MPTFRFAATVTVSAYTTVDADTKEAALEIAKERNAVIGGIGSGEAEDESWIIEEADGEPDNIHAAD